MAEKQYDFTHVPKRQGNSIKWGVLKEKELPMWIAEMDFKIAPEIMASMEEKLKVAAFGYESVPAEYYKAVADWEEIEHRARPKEDWCVFASGVVPAISAMVLLATKFWSRSPSTTCFTLSLRAMAAG